MKPSQQDVDLLLKAGRLDQSTRCDSSFTFESDQANQLVLDGYIQRNGWPPLRQDGIDRPVSSELAQAAWHIMQHGDLTYINKHLPLLKDAVRHGQADRVLLAMTIDRARMYEGRPQIYGTNAVGVSETEQEVFVAGSMDQVELRRQKIGIREPLSAQAARMGAKIVTTAQEPDHRARKIY